MLRSVIVFVISNYPLTLLVVGLLVGLIAGAPSRGRSPGFLIESLLAWYVFFNVGVSYLVNFVFHSFYGEVAAAFIGWADSPFQLEVGTASLGFALVGFVAAFGSFDRRLCAVLGPSVFALGAAVGHVNEMVRAHNYAPGNAGPIFYTDIAVPLLGFLLLWLSRREAHRAGAMR